MNWIKKISIRIFILLYALSYFLQNSFFITRRAVYAAQTPTTTNLVAVIIDKDIYKAIITNITRYTTQYIQKKIANSKAVVLPIDTSTLQAHEISQILENMYFEGLKDESSKLVGTILIGNVPLPVVENNGFVYPSIYPYVDFEQQQFIYDSNKEFFVYNDNPNGQAEIRHGLIQFDTAAQYNTFFTKLRSYYHNPTDFIDTAIWYDDFIGTKKYFIPENTKYYVNSMIFGEDIGYHRYNPLLLSILTEEHNQEATQIGSTLGTDLQNTEDQGLKSYANMIEERSKKAEKTMKELRDGEEETTTQQPQTQDAPVSTIPLPTLTLKKSTQEMLKSYDGLLSTIFLSKTKDNIGGLARRYKNTDGKAFTDINGTTDKIVQQDNRILGDTENDMPSLLIQINDRLEKEIDNKIEEEKYYITTPIPLSELHFEGDVKIPAVGLPKCIRNTYDYYENYYFGKNAKTVTNAQETSIYRGTYQNLQTIGNQNANNIQQSIGSSYKIFSTQIEANRGYDFNSTQDEVALYNILKTNKQELRNRDCNLRLFGYCIRRKKTRKPKDNDDEDKCYTYDEEKQGGCESLTGFSMRMRGGASPLNINETTQKLENYNYKDARLPIYNIAGAKKIEKAEPFANTYIGSETYVSMIQERFAVKEKQENKFNNIYSFINNPNDNGIDLKFTNQKPSNTDLANPIRKYNPPKTYAQSNFFLLYPMMPSRIIYGNKIILYKRKEPTYIKKLCDVEGQIFTYKTIDSRIKNTAPTRNQVSSTEFYKFKNGSEIEKFYNNIMNNLVQKRTDIIEKNEAFSGTSLTGETGIISNLKLIKEMINSGNNGALDIIGFDHNTLTSMTQSQINTKANNWSINNLNTTKLNEISGRIQTINEELDQLLSYINNTNLNSAIAYITNIIETEKTKKQNVEILTSQKTNIYAQLDMITTNINTLKTIFLQAQQIYTTTNPLQNKTTAIQSKRNNIANLQGGNGCSTSYYKAICDVLDGIIALNNNIEDLNEKIENIQEYAIENDENGVVQIFVELNNAFSSPEIISDVNEIKTTINTFQTSNDENKKEINKGMSLVTQDRPIDNIRNITFKGIGGDVVQLNYPNIYEVEVYKEVDDKLILKTTEEIAEAIKTYLTNKAVTYNTLLEEQLNKKAVYYGNTSAQFNFLGQFDPLANPNRNYNLIPTDYFIKKTVEFFKQLEDIYTKQYIYGNNHPNTDEQRIDFLAKFLYQQNKARPEKMRVEDAIDGINEAKSSFDVNIKIHNVIQNYIVENNDQGRFLMPTYRENGYEIGFINSDGEDYISAKPLPNFIQQIQLVQRTQTESETSTNKIANTFIEDPTQRVALQKKVDLCAGVDTKGMSLIVDIKTMSSPRAKAMKCRAQNVLDIKFDISFKHAQGPVVFGIFDELKASLDQRTGQRKEYGAQRGGTSNESVLQQTTGTTKKTLEGYNTYALPKIDTNTISVDSTGGNKLRIGMIQDIGNINIKISAIGDNCFGITRNGRMMNENLCTKPYKEYYNPAQEELVFDLVLTTKKAGSTSVQIELCTLPTTTTPEYCITKPQIIHTLPGPITDIQLTTATSIVMEGASIPLIIKAQDAYGNNIGQSTQSYTINTNHGHISDGSAYGTSVRFDNFASPFIYEAPTELTDNKAVNIWIVPVQEEQRLTNENIITQEIKKNIIAAKGIVSVYQDNTMLYKTETNPIQEEKIVFTLPKNESDIQYQDTNELPQINGNALPKLRIEVKDRYGHKLDTVANITSKNKYLDPGILVTNEIQGTTQTLFRSISNFMIQEGNLEFSLYPSFKAGTDTLTIAIPGLDPITIEMEVYAGEAKKVIMSLEKNKINLTTTTGSKGTIQIVDSRDNLVQTPTNIRFGIIGAAETNIQDIVYTGGEYAYHITSKSPGGEGYVFAYLKDRPLHEQFPGYQKFIVQESILPTKNLNIVYLNLFGTDRGNQRGYFSENDRLINTITEQSNKLLATTTQLIDPTKIKQIPYIITPNGQIQSLNQEQIIITTQDDMLVAQIPQIATIELGTTNSFGIQKIDTQEEIAEFNKQTNSILYLPEPTDSIIESNETTKKSITINKQTIIDLENNIRDQNITIEATHQHQENMHAYSILREGKLIGTIRIRSSNITQEKIQIEDPLNYGKTATFSKGSTNNAAIGIYTKTSTFTKTGYPSIEDSADAMLGIGFSSDFKNIANFANGKTVGEATVPYGSHFLINFGDPLLQRTEKNTNIPDTDFDASIGEQLYTDPNKIILKATTIDFNNNGLQDIIVVYTDGTVKLLKNHGGTHPYKNMQELMLIAEPIKELHIGDVDGNNYEDIIIITNNNKGIVYFNNKGIFEVDGKTICLNTNTEPNIQSSDPANFGNIEQMFIADMNKDGIIDIVTNDQRNDIKIFYGGNTNNGANYISQNNGVCDSGRYDRQKDNYTTVKRFGIKINNNRYIQDESLVHWQGLIAPVEGIEEEISEEAEEEIPEKDPKKLSKDELKKLKDDMKKKQKESTKEMENFVEDLDTYIQAGMSHLAYVDNPLHTAPIYYQNTTAKDIYYLPIKEENEHVTIYKEFQDINGGILKNNDEVVVQTTILSKKNNNKITYIDTIKGPWSINKTQDNKIPSLLFVEGETGALTINRDVPPPYNVIIDNIQLNTGEKIIFSYKITYQQSNIITINIEDVDLIQENKYKNEHLDIIVNTNDPCQKNRWIFLNDTKDKKKTYEEFFKNIEDTLHQTYAQAQEAQKGAISNILTQLNDVEDLNGLQNIQSIGNSLGGRTLGKSLIQIATDSMYAGGTINISSNIIDSATANVSKKIDQALEGMCKGFVIGKDGCGGVPVPFNQAFLAPGDYHIFGCVPKPPNPLYIPFQTLNKTLGKGMPLLTFPGNRGPVLGAYIPFPGIFGFPFKGATDGFFLGAPGGPYPSQFRLYIVPTLTLGLGMALCFGPYNVATKIPKPFADMGGNCIVFALPPITNCPDEPTTDTGPKTERINPNLKEASEAGVCNNPPTTNTTTISTPNNQLIMTQTSSSPLQIVYANPQGTTTPSYTAAIPQGNFGGLIQIDQDPITVTSVIGHTDVYDQYDGYDIAKEKVPLNKIVGAKTKGLVQCVIQDWTTRQIQYIQNNLTKFSLHIDLPDITYAFQGIDKIGNLQETYKTLNEQDRQAGYIQTPGTGQMVDLKQRTGETGGKIAWTRYISSQQINSINEQLGNNPFEAIQSLFTEIPLINIETKTINIKIPGLTSEEINKHINYLTLWTEQAKYTIEERGDFFLGVIGMCSVQELQDHIKNKKQIQEEIQRLQNKDKKTPEEEKQLTELEETLKKIDTCQLFQREANKFIAFKENSAGLIRSIQQNIKVLEQYKQFPSQLHQRTHLSDRYMTELSDMLSSFLGDTMYWLNTNANRYSQYVDAITTIVGAIQTWQAIIDFSVNRSEKCSKCSNDNYGSFSCSLSFLCPQLPIFPIPAFKIPNIYMDMSNIELGMDILLPKINFVPTKIPLPQIPKLPEPPNIEIDRDILFGLNIDFFRDMTLPTIPVIPAPPQLPEPPSFIPSISMQLPVLPPAPKIPKIIPEVDGILKVADFIGKVFCIIKGGIGLVGEKSVKGKVEQITQRTRNVPIFDFFDLTTKFQDPPLQGFDYQLDAYATLKFNFNGVYDVFNAIASVTNNIVSQEIDAHVQKGIERTTEQLNKATETGFQLIESLNAPIQLNYNQDDENLTAYYPEKQKLKAGLMQREQVARDDKATTTKIKQILATIDTTPNIQTATKELTQIGEVAQQILQTTKKENKELQEQLQEYDRFIEQLRDKPISLVHQEATKTTLSAPLFHIDTPSKQLLQGQKNPTQSYLEINKQLVDGYLYALNTDGPQKLNMNQSTYNKSKTYLETTKKGIESVLLGYENTPMIAQATCTNCRPSSSSNNYSTDISAYVQGIFVEAYSGTEKEFINTVISTDHIQKTKKSYQILDLNNNKTEDIMMVTNNTIYVKYGKQTPEHRSAGNGSLTTYYSQFYSYASQNISKRYISSLEQLRNNSDAYGYTKIRDIIIKVIDTDKEVKNFRTDGQGFDTLQISWTNSLILGEEVDGYIIKTTKKIDEKDTPSSFRNFLSRPEKPKYLLILPQGTDYKNILLTIDEKTTKRPVNIDLGDKILAVEYYTPSNNTISVTFKDLPRERLYTNIAALRITQEELTNAQRQSLVLYKKSSPRSNQTVAGMQNIGDISPPVGDIVLWRNITDEAVSTGNTHDGYINTNYTLKSIRTDNVAVTKMIVQKDGQTILEKDNDNEIGTLDIEGLFFTGTTQEKFEFIAIDQNNNIAREMVTLFIKIPEIEIIDVKETGEETAEIIAEISHDLDEGTVSFQRMRNNIRNNINGTNQNSFGGFNLIPKQTIITGDIFTMGRLIGIYDEQNNQIASIDPDTGEIKIQPAFVDSAFIHLNLKNNTPIVEIKNTSNNMTLFQIILPVKNIIDIQLNPETSEYQKTPLQGSQFGSFNGGYCIQNTLNDCILYTNQAGLIYIPRSHANNLVGAYIFDAEKKQTIYTIKDTNHNTIATITVHIKTNK